MEKAETQKWQPMIRDNKCNGVVSCAGQIQRLPLKHSLKSVSNKPTCANRPKLSICPLYISFCISLRRTPWDPWGSNGIFEDSMGSLRSPWDLWEPHGTFEDPMGSLRTLWDLWGPHGTFEPLRWNLASALFSKQCLLFHEGNLLLCRFVEAWGPPYAPSVPVAPNLAHFGWFC